MLYSYGLSLDTNKSPKRFREATKLGDKNSIVQGMIDAAEPRTLRLIKSFDELEREVWGCAAQTNISTSQSRIDADPSWRYPTDFGDEWWKHWGSTLGRARRVHVPENYLTQEFREARRIGLDCKPVEGGKWQNDFDTRGWPFYELHRLSRHKWGQYLRSNMDWDWDLGTCMKRLFKIENRSEPFPDAKPPPASSPRIDVGAGTGGMLKISMEEAQAGLPREVQIAYKLTTGRTHYLTFTQPCPSPGHLSVSESSCIVTPSSRSIPGPSTGVKQDSGYGTGSSVEGPQIEDLEIDASSSGTSRLKASEGKSVEEYRDGYEGKDIDFHKVRVEGYAISICSLD